MPHYEPEPTPLQQVMLNCLQNIVNDPKERKTELERSNSREFMLLHVNALAERIAVDVKDIRVSDCTAVVDFFNTACKPDFPWRMQFKRRPKWDLWFHLESTRPRDKKLSSR